MTVKANKEPLKPQAISNPPLRGLSEGPRHGRGLCRIRCFVQGPGMQVVETSCLFSGHANIPDRPTSLGFATRVFRGRKGQAASWSERSPASGPEIISKPGFSRPANTLPKLKIPKAHEARQPRSSPSSAKRFAPLLRSSPAAGCGCSSTWKNVPSRRSNRGVVLSRWAR